MAKDDPSYMWFQRSPAAIKEFEPWGMPRSGLDPGWEIVQYFFAAAPGHPIMLRVVHNLISRMLMYTNRCPFKFEFGPGLNGSTKNLLYSLPKGMATAEMEKRDFHDRPWHHVYCTAYYAVHDLTGPTMWSDNLLAGIEEFSREFKLRENRGPSPKEAHAHMSVYSNSEAFGVHYQLMPNGVMWDDLRHRYMAGSVYYGQRVPLVFPWDLAKKGIARKINRFALQRKKAMNDEERISFVSKEEEEHRIGSLPF